MTEKVISYSWQIRKNCKNYLFIYIKLYLCLQDYLFIDLFIYLFTLCGHLFTHNSNQSKM